MPYDEYTAEDVANRIIYVEVSRGCPFTCEFCLSSLDVPVRQFPLAPFLEAMDHLLARGVRHFKFVDRTFNLSLPTSTAILEFFLARWVPGLFLHFEMIPDRLPEGLRALIRRFPAGALQFEIGIQTFDPETAQRISRRQDYGRLEDNLAFLRRETGVHIHADLIAGLPGEGMATFAAGFDRLVRLQPQEIQVGILKRLRGTPIVRHDSEWQMVYSPVPPYELLQSRSHSFGEMRLFGLFARFWDLVANSGNFVQSTPLLWQGDRSPFHEFRAFAEWVHARAGRRHGIALSALAGFLFEYLTLVRGLPAADVRSALLADYARTGRTDTPACLRTEPSPRAARKDRRRQSSVAGRQRRHGGLEREGSVPGVAGAGG